MHIITAIYVLLWHVSLYIKLWFVFLSLVMDQDFRRTQYIWSGSKLPDLIWSDLSPPAPETDNSKNKNIKDDVCVELRQTLLCILPYFGKYHVKLASKVSSKVWNQSLWQLYHMVLSHRRTLAKMNPIRISLLNERIFNIELYRGLLRAMGSTHFWQITIHLQ